MTAVPERGRRSTAVLLDFGGVVCRHPLELLPRWATRQGFPEVGARSGPFGTRPDELWQRVQRRELTERDYWERRAAEFGALLGERWASGDLITRVSQVPDGQLVRPEASRLLDAAYRAGTPTGVLSNDLEFFFGADWVANSSVLRRFDVVVDGSLTGVLKPDPRSFRHAAERLRVDVSELVFLDDLPWNADAASAIGATGLYVNVMDPAPAFRAAAHALGLIDTLPGHSPTWMLGSSWSL